MNPIDPTDDRTPDQIYEDWLNESAEPEEEEDWSVDVRDEPSYVVPA